MPANFEDLLTGDIDEDEIKKPIGKLGKRKAKPTKPPKMPRPKGLSREAYGLLNAGILAVEEPHEVIRSIMPARMAGYKEAKAQLGLTRAHKFHWVPFVNPARSDNLQLFHWEREDKRNLPYKFADLNKVLKIDKYTDNQYWTNFSIPDWTKMETDHLFDLARRFDLRWPIILDRYDKETFKARTIEDLKERYYYIVNWLESKTDNNDNIYNYDANHERRRKLQLEKQWNRTPEQLAEEQELLGYMKIIDNKKKERVKRASQLQHLMDSLAAEEEKELVDSVCSENVSLRSARKSRSRTGRRPPPGAYNSPHFTIEAATKHFRWHTFKKAGVHLRCQEHLELKIKTGRRQLNINKLMDNYYTPVEYSVFNSEEMMPLISKFKRSVCVLQDLKDTLAAAEYELMVLQKKFPDREVRVPPMFRLAPVMAGPVPQGLVGQDGMPSTTRKLTSLIEKIEKDKKD